MMRMLPFSLFFLCWIAFTTMFYLATDHPRSPMIVANHTIISTPTTFYTIKRIRNK